MPTGATIQQKISKGYAKFAKVAGDSYAWYRPVSAINPITTASLLGNVLAQFAPDSTFTFFRPSEFASASRWFGSFSTQINVQAGDYFVGQLGIFYIADVERFTSIQCVWCNRTVSVGRAQDALALGASSEYGGASLDNLTIVLEGWPASLRQLGSGMKMKGTGMQLPSDAPLPAMGLLIPSLIGAPLGWNDIVTDETGARFVVSTLEFSPLGWRASLEEWPPG